MKASWGGHLRVDGGATGVHAGAQVLGLRQIYQSDDGFLVTSLVVPSASRVTRVDCIMQASWDGYLGLPVVPLVYMLCKGPQLGTNIAE